MSISLLEDDLGLFLLLLQRMKIRKKRVANRAVRKELTMQDTTAVVTYWQETVPPGNNTVYMYTNNIIHYYVC